MRAKGAKAIKMKPKSRQRAVSEPKLKPQDQRGVLWNWANKEDKLKD